MKKIAIIGAGLAGLTCARRVALAQVGVIEVTIFEKSRGIGGRMATRYAGEYEFDHGAQYFTENGGQFGAFVAEQQTRSTVAPWPPKIEKLEGGQARSTMRYVAVPRMNSLCKSLAEPLDVRLKTHIAKLSRRENGWYLLDQHDDEYGPFDCVISAMPAPQMLALMPEAFVDAREALSRVRMAGCFSLMLGFDQPVTLPWTAARIGRAPIGWIADNSDKPGRNTAQSVLIQSSNDWAEAHLEAAPETVEEILLEEASRLTGTDLGQADHKRLHRWRYAATPEPLGQPFLFDPAYGLAACGDWCLGSKVSAAFDSGAQLADALLAEIARGRV